MSILNPRHYLCYRAESPVTLDGRLDDGAWASAPWSDDFRDILGDAKPKPRLRTRVKMLWDDRNLYIGADLEEPLVWATIKQPDAVVFYDNDFEVFIDPDGDNHVYYEIELNAFGTVWDQVLTKPYRDGGVPLTHWDLKGMKVVVHVDGKLNNPSVPAKGWSVEIAIPWSGIMEDQQSPNGTPYPKRNYRPAEGEQWRINFSRVEWDVEVSAGEIVKKPGQPEHNWTWCEQGAVDMHRPEHWGILEFTSATPGEGKLTPDPSAPAREALFRLYYAQKAFWERHGKWASTVSELSDVSYADLPLVKSVELHTTPSLFEAFATVETRPGTLQKWAISSDSRFWEVR